MVSVLYCPVQCTIPIIWRFTEAIHEEKGLTDAQITKRLMGYSPEPQQRKWKQSDKNSRT